MSNPDHYLGYIDNQVAYVLPDDGYLGISSPAFTTRKNDYTRMKRVTKNTWHTPGEAPIDYPFSQSKRTY